MNKITWKIENTVLCADIKYFRYTPNKDTVLFDLDDTIITTKGKHIFPKNSSDWKWLFDEITVNKLKELTKQKYNIIFISNQSILKTEQNINDYKIKIQMIAEELKINFKLYASLKNDKYRKPNLGIYEDYLSDLNIISYTGDACGRQQTETKKKDFSDSDYKFALNMNVPFYTPEEYFLKKECGREKCIGFNIKEIKNSEKKEIVFKNRDNFIDNKLELEMIIAVGVPASGKSTYFKKIFGDSDNHVIINQDTLKTKAKCLKETNKALDNKMSVIIDATNPSKKTRKEYIDIAKKYNAVIKCFHFDTPIDLAHHCNNYRAITDEKEKISKMVYRIYSSKYEEPSLKEGFDQILNIPFNIIDEIVNDSFFNHYSA